MKLLNVNNLGHVIVVKIYVIALFSLLLNDFILKFLYPGMLTGKLSDFAGLFVLPVFLSIILRTKSIWLFLGIGLLFILWKMPIADQFIIFWNEILPLKINRVIDPSDYIALTSVVFAFITVKRSDLKISYSRNYVTIGVLSIFAFSATSYYNEIKVEEFITLDSGIHQVKKNLMKMDSVEWMHKLDTSSLTSDTLICRVDYDFCFDGFEAVLALEGDSIKSKISILTVIHDCPLNNDKVWGPDTRDDKSLLTRVIRNRILKSIE